MSAGPHPQGRDRYPRFTENSARWMDPDAYGQVDNVVHYSVFDTVVNRGLIEQGARDFRHGRLIGLVVETPCNHFAPLTFPQVLEAGLRVARVGASSVRHEVGLFAPGEPLSTAAGRFVHDHVDRDTRRPTPLPPAPKAALEPLQHQP